MPRLLALLALLTLVPLSPAAGPRDEVLRLVPADAAIVGLAQNAREHVRAVAGSPFAKWLSASEAGKAGGGADAKMIQLALEPVALALGVKPDELLDDMFGDAVAFAYSPPPAADPAAERGVLLVRPRKPEALRTLVDRVNALQATTGEVKAVVKKTHAGEEYWARQKPDGGAEFYAYRGGVFAFSGTEPDIRAVIDRDRAPDRPAEKGMDWGAALARLKVEDAAAVVLVNPRPLDAEVKAKLAAAKPDEKPVLEAFATVWAALDAAAVYLAVGADAEVGLSVAFRPDALPPAARGWLTGARTPSRLWAAVPPDAPFAAAGRFGAGELLDLFRALLGADGRKGLDAALADGLGPLLGKDKIGRTLAAVGPDWAVWAEPPRAGEGVLPVLVGAVEVGPADTEAERGIRRAVAFGVEAARFHYNRTHPDQIDLTETRDGDVTVVTLSNPAVFPPGVRPSYAFKGGFLVAASTPEAVKRFRPPAGGVSAASAETVAGRFSGPTARDYLKAHRDGLAAFVGKTGGGPEADVRKQIDEIVGVLEAVDRVEVVVRGTDAGLKVGVRAKLVKPLK